MSDVTSGNSSSRPSLEVARSFIPQITFECGFPTSGTSHNFINVMPSLINHHIPLADFIISNNWQHIGIMYEDTPLYTLGATSLRHYLQSRGVSTALKISSKQQGRDNILLKSRLRVIVLYSSASEASNVVCSTRDRTGSRFVWLLPGRPGQSLNDILEADHWSCVEKQGKNIFLFLPEMEHTFDQSYELFTSSVSNLDVSLTDSDREISAYAHDAALLVLNSLWRMKTGTFPGSHSEFASRLVETALRLPVTGATGLLQFHLNDGSRVCSVLIYKLKGGEFVHYSTTGADLGPDIVTSRSEDDSIPFSLLVVICSFSLLGAIYTLVIMGFNVYYRKDRMIKMTSPNLNSVMLIGALLGYACMSLVGLDVPMLTLANVELVLKICTFFIIIGFTLTYGSLLTKSWRVYLIFKNLNFNGKTTRDEHLLLVVFGFLSLDLILLVTWIVTDPLRCYRQEFYTVFYEDTFEDVTFEGTYCRSTLQPLWVCVAYLVKLPVILAGGYLAFQIRHVTLPSLRDTTEIYVVIYAVLMTSLIALPLLLTSGVATTTRFIVAALLLFVVITTTITLLYIPKVYVVRKSKDSDGPNAGLKFLFSESLKRTQANASSCSLCCCLPDRGEDKYAQEVLATEIETLTKTISEKDVTIRELTDRLFFLAGQYRDMGTPKTYPSPLRQLPKPPTRRITSQPIYPTHTQQGLDRCLSDRGPSRPHTCYAHHEEDYDTRNMELSAHALAEENMSRDRNQGFKKRRAATIHTDPTCGSGSRLHLMSSDNNLDKNSRDSQRRSPSPNNDSAIDNTSPSSSNSERGTHSERGAHSVEQINLEYVDNRSYRDLNRPNHRKRWVPSQTIDLRTVDDMPYPSRPGHYKDPAHRTMSDI